MTVISSPITQIVAKNVQQIVEAPSTLSAFIPHVFEQQKDFQATLVKDDGNYGTFWRKRFP